MAAFRNSSPPDLRYTLNFHQFSGFQIREFEIRPPQSSNSEYSESRWSEAPSNGGRYCAIQADQVFQNGHNATSRKSHPPPLSDDFRRLAAHSPVPVITHPELSTRNESFFWPPSESLPTSGFSTLRGALGEPCPPKATSYPDMITNRETDVYSDVHVPSPSPSPIRVSTQEKHSRTYHSLPYGRSPSSPSSHTSTSTDSSTSSLPSAPRARNAQATIPMQNVLDKASETLKCAVCGWVQNNNRRGDFERHVETHYREGVVKWLCGGLPVDSEATARTMANPHCFDGQWYAGGCLKPFSRGDALKRHQDNENLKCCSMPDAPYNAVKSVRKRF